MSSVMGSKPPQTFSPGQRTIGGCKTETRDQGFTALLTPSLRERPQTPTNNFINISLGQTGSRPGPEYHRADGVSKWRAEDQQYLSFLNKCIFILLNLVDACSRMLEISVIHAAPLTGIESGHQVAAKSPLLLPMSRSADPLS